MKNGYSVPFYPLNIPHEEKARMSGQFTRMGFPLSVAVSLGEYPCSNRCRMCPQHTTPITEKARMSEETFTRILDQLDGSPPFNLELSSYGETLDHEQATNGIPLDEEKARALLDTGVDVIQVSINAGSRDSYRWLCGTDNYPRVAENLKNLCRICREGGYTTVVNTHIIEIREQRHEFEEFIQDWKDVVFSAEIRAYGNWSGLVDENGCTGLRRSPPERYPCLGLWASLKIVPNGDLYKCFVHSVPTRRNDGRVGSIYDHSIAEAWQGERLNLLRRLHQESRFDELESCRACACWMLLPNLWGKVGSNGSTRWALAEEERH
jgi:radical SAM protein with 4Fe4S-binding SPASM domain